MKAFCVRCEMYNCLRTLRSVERSQKCRKIMKYPKSPKQAKHNKMSGAETGKRSQSALSQRAWCQHACLTCSCRSFKRMPQGRSVVSVSKSFTCSPQHDQSQKVRAWLRGWHHLFGSWISMVFRTRGQNLHVTSRHHVRDPGSVSLLQ